MTSQNLDNNITIGVLALQGCIDLHVSHILSCGVNCIKVKYKEDFDKIDGLILPGGESTAMLKVMDLYGLGDIISNFVKNKPVYGICAGSILMARDVTPSQKSFNVFGYDVLRNGEGRQINSKNLNLPGTDYAVSFIRPPVFSNVSNDVEIKWEVEGRPVWLSKDDKMVTSFHPELNDVMPSPIHKEFVEIVRRASNK